MGQATVRDREKHLRSISFAGGKRVLVQREMERWGFAVS
jgi:hypothetical protein